jgi:hypothetical protein
MVTVINRTLPLLIYLVYIAVAFSYGGGPVGPTIAHCPFVASRLYLVLKAARRLFWHHSDQRCDIWDLGRVRYQFLDKGILLELLVGSIWFLSLWHR